MKLLLFVSSFFLISQNLHAAPFFAHGEYASTNQKGASINLKIDRKGRIKTDFPMTIPQGAPVSISFPEPLSWDPEDGTFFTQGWFAVQMVGPGVSVVCQYPVSLEVVFYGSPDEADVTLSFSQRYFFRNGLCTREGEAETFHIFRRYK